MRRSDLATVQRLLLAIQDSQLAHSALQLRYVENECPELDILFEATETGLVAQIEQLRSIVTPATLTDQGSEIWKSRQELYAEANSSDMQSVVAKVSVCHRASLR